MIQLVDWNSALWYELGGECGWENNIKDLKIIVGEEKVEDEEAYEIAFEQLEERLCHQMSFDEASYLCIPYLVKYLVSEEVEGDFEKQIKLFELIGIILATDVPSNEEKESVEKTMQSYEESNELIAEVIESYEESIELVKEKAKVFLKSNIEELKARNLGSFSKISVAMLAILGDRELAGILIVASFEECYVLCPECDYCDEDLVIDSEEIDEKVVVAESVIGKWDGESYDDTYLWFTNILHKLGDEEAIKVLSYYYGNYTCPECGHKDTVVNLAKLYFTEG